MKKVLLLVFLTISAGITANDDFIEEVVVTGSRISDGDYYDMPAITLKKSADFFTQRIRLINDSRSPDLRKQEIYASIRNLIRSATKNKGIQLSYGQGFLLPVNLDDDSLELIDDSRKSDTSYIDIYIKNSISKDIPVRTQLTTLKDFINKAKLVSRNEIEVQGDIGLSIIDPQQYRYAIIERIHKENQKLKGLIGSSCEITIGGLENRVEWERSSVDSLVLYIAYGTDIKCN